MTTDRDKKKMHSVKKRNTTDNKNRQLKIALLFLIFVSFVFMAGCDSRDRENVNETIPTSANKSEGEDNMNPIVVIETNLGNIEVQLDAKNAPITTKNFLQYVNEGYYNGTIFHRVISNFMIQGGGFTQDGVQKQTHSPIKLESANGLKNNRGTIAMARTNVSDSATSQFFINVVDNSFLNYVPKSSTSAGNDGYAVFGKVVSGMDVVDKIKNVKTSTTGGFQDWPTETIIINGVHVKQ